MIKNYCISAVFYLCCQLVEGKISPEKLLKELDIGELNVGDDDSDDKDYDYCSHKKDFREVLCFALNMLAARCEELAVALIKSMAAREENSFSDDNRWNFHQNIEYFDRMD